MKQGAFLTLLLFLLSFSAGAATITWNGNTSTDFNDATNWTGGLPGSGDNIIIPNNPTAGRFPVMSSGTYTVSSITINSGATLTISGGSITLSSATTINGTFNISGGQYNGSGNMTLGSGAVVNQSGGTIHLNSNPLNTPTDHLVINAGGTFNQTGGTTEVKDFQLPSATSTFNQSGATSILRIDHDYKNIGGSFNSTGGTIEWTGAAGSGANYVVGTNQFYHVVIGAGDPKFDNDNNSQIAVRGNWTNNSSVSTLLNQKITWVTFNGTGDQTIGGSYPTPFYNMTVNKASGILYLGINCTANKNGTVSISSGTMDLQGYTLNAVVAGGSGVFEILSGGTLRISGTTGGQSGSNFPAIFTGMNLAAGSTVEYTGTATQTIYTGPFSYSNLKLTNGVKTTAADVSVNGNLTVNTGATLMPTATALITGTGTLTGTGTVVTNRVAATADFVSQYTITNKSLLDLTVDYSASAAQTVNALNYGNLTISGSRGTSNVTLANSGTIGIAKVFNPTASYSSGNYVVTNSTVDFNGNIDQTVPAFTYNNLVASGSGTVKSTNGTVAFLTAITVNSNVTLDLLSNLLTSGITTTNNGTIRTRNTSAAPIPLGLSWGGNIEYNHPTGGQTVASGTYNNVTINHTAGTSATAGNVTVTSTLNLTAGTLAVGTYTMTMRGNITGTTGVLDVSAGTLLFNGTSSQNVAANTLSSNIKDLKISNSSGVTLNSNCTVTNVLTLTTGNLVVGGSTNLSIAGTISKASGYINATSGTVTFNGSIEQNIPANSFTGAVNNLTVNNASGVKVNSNETVSAALNLANGHLDINGTTLTVGGTVTGTGKLRGSTVSNLTVASTGTVGTVNFDQTTDESTNALANMAVSGGTVALGNKLNLFTVLNVSGGTFNLDGKNLVLKSSAANTARVAPVTGGMSNYTNVTVERYIPDDERRYRLLSPGVTSTGSIRDNWMEGALNTCFWGEWCNINPKPGYGTHISGSGHYTNGFDITQTNASSLYTFNQSTGSWVAVPNTNGSLEADKGYLIFIRGDRSVDMTLVGAPITLQGTSTTLRATGSLRVGTQTATALASNGSFSLLANPYASPVSWSNIHGNNSSNFEDYYTYWDPKVGVRGSFVTVTTTGLKSSPTSNATVEIQGGQAFFVKTKTGVNTPSLSMRESDKSTTANINVFRSGLQTEQLYASLYFKDPNNNSVIVDGVLTAFGNHYSAAVDGRDAQQIANWDEDVAIIREGKSLSIETRPLVDETDTIFLSIARLKQQGYQWQFDPSNFMTTGIEAYLEDRFLKNKTPLDMYGKTVIEFNVTSDPLSFAANRFFISFKVNPAVVTTLTLPVEYTALRAFEKGKAVGINWRTASEQKTISYEVEKAGENGKFTTLTTVVAQKGQSNNYSAEDPSPVVGVNYYRIKAVGRSGEVKYSNVAVINTGVNHTEISIYPNPVRSSVFTVQLRNFSIGQYNLQLVNAAGYQLLTKTIDHEGGFAAHNIAADQALPPGLYKLVLTKGNEKWSTTLYAE